MGPEESTWGVQPLEQIKYNAIAATWALKMIKLSCEQHTHPVAMTKPRATDTYCSFSLCIKIKHGVPIIYKNYSEVEEKINCF